MCYKISQYILCIMCASRCPYRAMFTLSPRRRPRPGRISGLASVAYHVHLRAPEVAQSLQALEGFVEAVFNNMVPLHGCSGGSIVPEGLEGLVEAVFNDDRLLVVTRGWRRGVCGERALFSGPARNRCRDSASRYRGVASLALLSSNR